MTMNNLMNYPRLVADIMNNGYKVESRLGPTSELIGAQVSFIAGTMVWRPKFSCPLGFMELIQLIAGVYEPEHLQRMAPSAKMEYFSRVSAYGPRMYDGELPEVDDQQMLMSHLHKVFHEFLHIKNTRRAVIFIAKSSDAPEDMSCTLTIQLLARDGILHTVVGMRSWDVIRGLPYDIMMFGGLTLAIAKVAKLKPGCVIVNAGSLHFYHSDLELVPLERKEAIFNFKISDKASWPGLRMICKNQVGEDWRTRGMPHFIEMGDWKQL